MAQVVRSIAVYVAFCAILLRALLPAGWMPNPNGASQSPLIICPMENPGAAMPGMTGPAHNMAGMAARPAQHQHNKSNDHDPSICSFAAAPHLAPPVLASALPLPTIVTLTVRRADHLHVAQASSRHTPQSPRAPPVSA